MNHQVWSPEHDMRGLGGDTTFTENAIRTMSWATYSVAADGRNRYIRDDKWLQTGMVIM